MLLRIKEVKRSPEHFKVTIITFEDGSELHVPAPTERAALFWNNVKAGQQAQIEFTPDPDMDDLLDMEADKKAIVQRTLIGHLIKRQFVAHNTVSTWSDNVELPKAEKCAVTLTVYK